MDFSDGEWPLSEVKEFALPSSLVNLLNFVIFDILLISLVFYFTTEISGRLNYVALSDGLPKRLIISCPPFVGGGLCSTSQLRITAMLLIRIVALLLIFASNLAIDGRSRIDIVKKMGLRRVSGPIDNITSSQFRTFIDRRASCQTSKDGFMYFGELRENEQCESNVALLTDPVAVSLAPQDLTANTGRCRDSELSAENFSSRSISVRVSRCDNAVIQCLTSSSGPDKGKITPVNCRGMIKRKGKTYACNIFLKKKGDSWTGNCREIRNFPLTNELWLPGLDILHTRIVETIGAITIAREGSTTLKFEGRSRLVTQLHYAWFGLLGAKILLTLLLGCFTAYLVWDGAICVVHDERSLASLLSSSVSRFAKSAHQDSPLYLNAKTAGNETTFWVSKYPLRSRANEARHKLEEDAIRGSH